MHYSVQEENLMIHCKVIEMGRDVQLCVYGGDVPHIGSVVLSEPRPSGTGNGVGVTSSVLNRMGHKEEAVARRFAEHLAARYSRTVCCSCGIHIDNAAPQDLARVMKLSEELLGKIAL